ncbi:MAG: hypothetical protein M3Q59_00540 [Actinomycetota bacterium]|nr:hypothetical protein [Actinomycetota bacterium]
MSRQRIGLWGTVIFAGASVVGVMVQLYLIGGYLFDPDDAWLDAHKAFGMIVHLAYILTFVFAIVAAWPKWRLALWPFVLAVIGSIQAFLAGGGDVGGGNAGLHAFHAALVPIVVILALFIGWAAWRHIRAMDDTTMNDPDRSPPPART